MPKNCAVSGCRVHNMLPGKRSFFQLPKRHRSPERRDAWLTAIDRTNRDGSRWSPVRSATICSEHFVTGKPVKTNYRHPDYTPSVFPNRPDSMKQAAEKLKEFEIEEELRAKKIRLEGDLRMKEESLNIRILYPQNSPFYNNIHTGVDNEQNISRVSSFRGEYNTGDSTYVNSERGESQKHASGCLFREKGSNDTNLSSKSDQDTSHQDSYPDTSHETSFHDAPNFKSSSSPRCEDEDMDPSSFLSVEIKEDPLSPNELQGSPSEHLPSESDFSRETGSGRLQDTRNTTNTTLTDTCNLRDGKDKIVCREINDKKANLNIVRLNASLIMNDDELTQFYTGLPDWNKFLATFMYLIPHVESRTKGSMPSINQYFITLVKLCQDLSFSVIASLSECDENTVRSYFWKWVDVSYLHYGNLIQWPDREALTENLPPIFRQKYPRLKSLIDCYELMIEQPSDYEENDEKDIVNDQRKAKAKVFIACSPLGPVNYVSHAWGYTPPDGNKERKYNFVTLGHFQVGDQILVARGCTQQEDFVVKSNAELIHYSRAKDEGSEECETSSDSSTSQVPVQSLVGLMKKRFGLLSGLIPIRSLKPGLNGIGEEELDCVCRIVRVCAALVNLEYGGVLAEPS